MPVQVLKRCTAPGCRNTRPCPTHPPITDRKTDAERKFYGSSWWQSARARHRRNEPLCREHMKRGICVAGTVVDHIRRIRDGADPYDESNWQTLCRPCHQAKRQHERYLKLL